MIRQFPDSVKLICETGTGYNNIDFNENNQYIVDKIIFNCIESEFKFIDELGI